MNNKIIKFVIIVICFLVLVGCSGIRITEEELLNKINDIEAHGYTVKDNEVYYQNSVLKNADLMSFEPLRDNYSKDKHYVYFWSNIIEGADPDSFGILVSRDYSKDDNKVYKRGIKLLNADAETFRLLADRSSSSNYYALDKNHVFHHGEVIQGSDPNTFENINDRDGKDVTGVYIFGERLENADSASFEFLSNYYAKDYDTVFFRKNGIWSKDDRIDASIIEILDNYYVKDNNTVYYMNEELEDVDVKTFEVINGFGKDKNNVYLHESKILEPIDIYSSNPFPNNYEITGFINIVERKCENDCMGEPYELEYVFFEVIDADNKNIFLFLKDKGNSFIRDNQFGLGCLDRENNEIYSMNHGDYGAYENKITGEYLTKLMASTNENPINMKITKPQFSGGSGAPLCYSHYRKFEVLD